jgi:hypothetical protein
VGAALALLGLVVLLFGVFGLIRGRLGWARIQNRRSAALVAVLGIVLLVLGGAISPKPSSKNASKATAATSTPGAVSPSQLVQSVPSAPLPATDTSRLSTATAKKAAPPVVTPSPAARFELGSAPTTVEPPPACSVAVASWTAALGPVSVTVNADGPTTVTVSLNAQTTQTASIQDGQITHQFDFNNDASTVKTVLVTATTGGPGGDELGGSCFATGSPNA